MNWEEAEPPMVKQTTLRARRREGNAEDAVPSALWRMARQGQALEVELGDAV